VAWTRDSRVPGTLLKLLIQAETESPWVSSSQPYLNLQLGQGVLELQDRSVRILCQSMHWATLAPALRARRHCLLL